MPVPDQSATIASIRARYPTPLGAQHAAFLIEAARATGAKLLRKDTGSHITLPTGVNVSQDILVFNGGQECYDVLGDAEGQATPTWQPKGAILGEYVDVSAPDDDDGDDDDDDLPADVRAALDALDTRVRTLAARVEKLEARKIVITFGDDAR